MEQGTRTRTTAATHMNANSSRSHMLIILQLKQVKKYIYTSLHMIFTQFFSLSGHRPQVSSGICRWHYCDFLSDLLQREHHKAVQHQPGGPGWQWASEVIGVGGRQTQRGHGHQPEPHHPRQCHQVCAWCSLYIQFGASVLFTPLSSSPAPSLMWRLGRRSSIYPTETQSSPSCCSLHWEATVALLWWQRIVLTGADVPFCSRTVNTQITMLFLIFGF